jgi:hypothetical protein
MSAIKIQRMLGRRAITNLTVDNGVLRVLQSRPGLGLDGRNGGIVGGEVRHVEDCNQRNPIAVERDSFCGRWWFCVCEAIVEMGCGAVDDFQQDRRAVWNLQWDVLVSGRGLEVDGDASVLWNLFRRGRRDPKQLSAWHATPSRETLLVSVA